MLMEDKMACNISGERTRTKEDRWSIGVTLGILRPKDIMTGKVTTRMDL